MRSSFFAKTDGVYKQNKFNSFSERRDKRSLLGKGSGQEFVSFLSVAERETFVHSCFLSSIKQVSTCEKGFFHEKGYLICSTSAALFGIRPDSEHCSRHKQARI